jgi:hypothetical protein
VRFVETGGEEKEKRSDAQLAGDRASRAEKTKLPARIKMTRPPAESARDLAKRRSRAVEGCVLVQELRESAEGPDV